MDVGKNGDFHKSVSLLSSILPDHARCKNSTPARGKHRRERCFRFIVIEASKSMSLAALGSDSPMTGRAFARTSLATASATKTHARIERSKSWSGLFLLRGHCGVGSRPDKQSISGAYKCHRADANPANVPGPRAGNPLPVAESSEHHRPR